MNEELLNELKDNLRSFLLGKLSGEFLGKIINDSLMRNLKARAYFWVGQYFLHYNETEYIMFDLDKPEYWDIIFKFDKHKINFDIYLKFNRLGG